MKIVILVIMHVKITLLSGILGCPNTPEKSEKLGFARAYSGTRMPELPENSELKFTACPTETRADSGFSEPDPNFPKPENPNAQPWSSILHNVQLIFLLINFKSCLYAIPFLITELIISSIQFTFFIH